MASLNKVMMIGRLTKPPEEPRVLPNSGSTVLKFRLAVGRSKKNPQTGAWENDPTPLYIDCEVFSRPDAKRNLADLVTRYVKQGDQLYLEGRLQLDEWDDKTTGQKRSKHKIVVDSIELLGGKAGDGGSGGDDGDTGGMGGGAPARGGGRPQQQPRGGSSPPDDDQSGGPDPDIPF